MQAERDFISFKVLLPTVTVPASITFDDGNQKKHFHLPAIVHLPGICALKT